MLEFIKKMKKYKGIYDKFYNCILFICKLLLVGDILITCYAVIGRYISFIDDPAWSEEVVLTFMSYLAMLSAALAIKRKAHIRMSALDHYLPYKLVKILDIIADISVFILGIIMLKVGWTYATGIGSRGFYISMPWLSKFWMYFPIPVAGIAMVIFEIETILADIEGLYRGEEK